MWMVRRSRAVRAGAALAPGAMGFRSTKALQLGRGVVGRHGSQKLPVEPEDERALGLAQPDRVLGHRLEDRLEVEGGPADHLEQLAGRRLLLEGDPQLAVARLQLREEAHVLDCDDRLVREGLQELDRAARERPASGRA